MSVSVFCAKPTSTEVPRSDPSFTNSLEGDGAGLGSGDAIGLDVTEGVTKGLVIGAGT
jgi:hypothetical protein